LSAPLDSAESERLFAPLAGHAHILIAVSGGPDSIALTALLNRWRVAGHRPLLSAATVDHGLRPDSATEAAGAAAFCVERGIAHAILTWRGPKPTTRIQESARKARYDLLFEHARVIGADCLVTGHTLDDQAETVLIRLARGSGPAGLAAMRPSILRQGIAHRRPLLDVPKARLLATCAADHLPFATDPANADPRFDRGRWRRLMPLLAEEGLTPERLGRLAVRSASLETMVETRAAETIARARLTPQVNSHSFTFDARLMLAEPPDVALRALACVVREASQTDDTVYKAHLRLTRLERLYAELVPACGSGRHVRRSIGGIVMTLHENGHLDLRREGLRRRGRSPR
jgi:tRNA(Ile)-lysidine synthase